LGFEVELWVEAAVARVVHVRVGLEDAPMGCALGNQALTERAQRLIAAAGGGLATASDVRAALKAASPVRAASS
jgi:3-keto-5-aminohexanoate cleavage enzyme